MKHQSFSPHQMHQQSGQIGIIVVLIMIVILTIGLSLATRTTQELALSQQEEESTRVFNAAETGVEQALSTDFTFNGDTYVSSPISPAGSNAVVTYTINKQYQLDLRLFQGVSAVVQLVDASNPAPPAQVYIDWSKETDCSTQVPASLLVAIFSSDSSTSPATTKVRYLTFESCSRSNNLGTAGISPGQNNLFKRATINLAATDQFIRIKPVYNDTQILVTSSTGRLPVQSYTIKSSGYNQSGTENRNVQVIRTIPTAPSIFDYALFSGTTVVK